MKSDCVTTEVIDLLEARNTGRLKTYVDGETLFHQGCPVERIYVIREGMVKAYSTSPDGKAQTYGIYKEGRILGVTAHLVWGKHKLTTEALGHVQVRLVPLAEFDRLLECDLQFSLAIIKELARIIDRLEDRITSLSFLDVRERLRHSLGILALEYGAEMDAGVKIDLDLTHEEIAELIVADRSTVTSYLTELRRQGYLWRDGHRLVMVPPEHITVLENLRQSISASDELVIGQWVARAIELNVEPARVLDALTEGLRLAEVRFQRGECGVPDVARGSDSGQ